MQNTTEMVPESLRFEIEQAVAGFAHGWCTTDKAIAMSGAIIETGSKVCVELGVYGGRSLIPIAMTLRHIGSGIVYGIDPWKKDNATEGNCSEADKQWWSTVNLNDIHNYCMSKIWEHELDKWCVVVRSQSHHCHNMFDNLTLKRRDRVIDFLHIDGCHSEESSTRDVELWIPRVRKGAYVFFDDIDWPTTKKAQEMMLVGCDLIGQVGNCGIYKRK